MNSRISKKRKAAYVFMGSWVIAAASLTGFGWHQQNEYDAQVGVSHSVTGIAVGENEFWKSVESGVRPPEDSAWFQEYVDLEPWIQEDGFSSDSRLIPNSISDIILPKDIESSFISQYTTNDGTGSLSDYRVNAEFVLLMNEAKAGSPQVVEIPEMTLEDPNFSFLRVAAHGTILALCVSSLYFTALMYKEADLSSSMSEHGKSRRAKKDAKEAFEDLVKLAREAGMEREFRNISELEAEINSMTLNSNTKQVLQNRVNALKEGYTTPLDRQQFHVEMLNSRLRAHETNYSDRQKAHSEATVELLNETQTS